MSDSPIPMRRFPSGVSGLDDVLGGGLPREAFILVMGPPGSGKTTIALQFLLEAVRNGEVCLLVTNAESPAQLHTIARSHGWRLDGVHIVNLAIRRIPMRMTFKITPFSQRPRSKLAKPFAFCLRKLNASSQSSWYWTHFQACGF